MYKRVKMREEREKAVDCASAHLIIDDIDCTSGFIGGLIDNVNVLRVRKAIEHAVGSADQVAQIHGVDEDAQPAKE
jgi:hypothetical protein